MTEFIKLGWIKLSKFKELTNVSEDAVKQRTTNIKYPEYRIGAGMIKLLSDGYYINYEIYQDHMNRQPDNYKVA